MTSERTSEQLDDIRYGAGPGPRAGRTHLERVRHLVELITYRPESYRVEVDIDRADPAGRVFIQVLHDRPDAFTGVMGEGKGGKRYLSPHQTDSEIVRTVFSACLAYEEHEVREFFQYRGKRVFGPHIDVEALATIADDIDIRP